jgi:D-threo-aldose 1-dehydrogenase
LRDAKLIVPGSTTATTPLGYGCSQLMGGISRREALLLLDTAFDSGIRHFDTAPSYGYGEAERVLGDALKARRQQVTIATKFGLKPPQNRTFLGVARSIVRPLVRRLPSVKSRLSRAAGGLVGRAQFSPAELRSSIEASLAALQTDYIDILLLHEAVVSDLSDELLAELDRSVTEGKIRSFGLGSEVSAAARIYRTDPRFCPVIQFEWSVLSAEKPVYPGSFVITHRSMSANLTRLRNWLAANPQVARRWSEELNVDVAGTAVLPRLMLAAARSVNAGGITLFSSRNAENIRTNAQLMLGQHDLSRGAVFAGLAARDASALLTSTTTASNSRAATSNFAPLSEYMRKAGQ